MAPPNESKPTPKVATAAAPKLTTTSTAAAAKAASPPSSTAPCLFSLRDGELTVSGDGAGKAAAATLLTNVPGNVTLTPFASAFHDPTTKASSTSSSDAPEELASQAAANAHRGAFLGFTLPPSSPASRAPCRVASLPGQTAAF